MRDGDSDEEREERIEGEIVVDAYDQYERAIGWYTYLEERIRFPFEARCIEEHELSPLEPGDEVRVVRMSSDDVCESDMFVTVEWMGREMGVALAQLEPIDVDPETERAIADWHYWDGQGYQF